MSIVVRRALPRDGFPQNLTRVAIERHHFERVLVIRADAVRMKKHLTFVHVRHGFRAGNDFALNRGR